MFASAFSSVLVISELTDPSVDDKSDADCFNMPETDSEATEEKVLNCGCACACDFGSNGIGFFIYVIVKFRRL